MKKVPTRTEAQRKWTREWARRYRAAHPKLIKRIRDASRKRNISKRRLNSVDWKRRNKHKVKAENLLNRAIRREEIIRPTSCERCGKKCKPHGHHFDYSKPLEVIWLCARCHISEHLFIGENDAPEKRKG